MITSQAIHRPVGRDDVRIVVATANRLSIALLPTRPGGPVQRRIVLKSRHVRRRVIEQTFTHAILVWAVAILQAAPEDLVDELFVLGDLFLVGLAELFHGYRQPGAGAAF